MDKRYFTIILKVVSLLISLVFLVLLGKYSLGFLYPFIIGIVIAKILNPAVSFFERKMNFPRLTATIVVTIISICIFLLLLFFILSELLEGIRFLSEILPKHIVQFGLIVKSFILENISTLYQKILSLSRDSSLLENSLFHQTIDQVHEFLGNTIAKLLKIILSSLQDLLLKIPDSLIIIIFISVISVVITYEYPYFLNLLRESIPKHFAEKANHFILELKHLFKNYIKALFLLSSISFLITYLGLLIVQIRAAFTIAILIGFIDLLPVIGPSLIFIPWIIYLFMSKNYMLTIKLSLLFMILIVIRQAVEPNILSKVFKVRFIYVLFIMFLTYKLGGLAGIVFTPLVIIMSIALKNIGFFSFIFKFIQK